MTWKIIFNFFFNVNTKEYKDDTPLRRAEVEFTMEIT